MNDVNFKYVMKTVDNLLSSRAPKYILKNSDHTRTQRHDSHECQAGIPAQELRAREHECCI